MDKFLWQIMRFLSRPVNFVFCFKTDCGYRCGERWG